LKSFKRVIENFTCEHCGYVNEGNGYTNHCESCLYSKHVDINPGDRANTCGGLMKPVSIVVKNGKYIVNHVCLECGFEKRNRVSKKDNYKAILEISVQK